MLFISQCTGIDTCKGFDENDGSIKCELHVMAAVKKLRIIVVCTPQYYVYNNGFLTYFHPFLFYELGKYTLKGMDLRILWRFS